MAQVEYMEAGEVFCVGFERTTSFSWRCGLWLLHACSLIIIILSAA